MPFAVLLLVVPLLAIQDKPSQDEIRSLIETLRSESVEERVLELQQSKAALLQDLLDESVAATAKVSLEDIKELLE